MKLGDIIYYITKYTGIKSKKAYLIKKNLLYKYKSK